MSSHQPHDIDVPSMGIDPVDYKTQLDEEASRAQNPRPAARDSNNEDQSVKDKITEKVSHYIPAAKKVLGAHDETEASPPTRAETESAPRGPPSRPDHDPQIEGFLRDTHKSMPVTGTEE